MGAKSEIEWTEATWNPTRGCSRISPGCENCYAERLAASARMSGPGKAYEHVAAMTENGPRWTRLVRFEADQLALPVQWVKGRRIFVDSMSDLFHESLTNEQIAAVFGVMSVTPRHTYQVLTKRAQRMCEWFRWIEDLELDHGPPPDHTAQICASNYVDCDQWRTPWPLPNVWLGVSVEDQEYAEERIPWLLQTRAATRFVSYEPALGPVNFRALRHPGWRQYDALGPNGFNGTRLDWVIVGGESGPGARSFDLAWALSVVEQCKAAGTACFVKQMGSRPRISLPILGHEPTELRRRHGVVGRDKGGDMSWWPAALRVREYPETRRMP